MDVVVGRRAVCNTDNHVVCARLCLKQGSYATRVPAGPRRGRFDVEKLASTSLKEEYQEQVTEKALEAWPKEGAWKRVEGCRA